MKIFNAATCAGGLVLVASLVNCGGRLQGEASEPLDSKAAVLHLLESQVAAWNRGDLEGFMSGYWHSPRLTYISGTHLTSGWENAFRRYQRRYKSEGREMGRLDFQDLEVVLLCSEAALVRGRFQLRKSSGDVATGLFTLALKKMKGEWKVIHDHTVS